MNKVWMAWGAHSSRKVNAFIYEVDKNLDDVVFEEYEFETEAELNAFLKGISEADGWMESYQVDDPNTAKKIIKYLKVDIVNKP